MFIDTHAHLTSEKILANVEGILLRAQEQKVDKIVNICTDQKSLEEGLLLSKKHPWVYNTASTTPQDVKEEGESFFPLVEQCARNGKLIGIGETGLDYFYESTDRSLQKEFLLRYFALALDCRLPLIFHCREAFADLFAFADSYYKSARAVLHCFTGTLTEAKGVLERGWYLSCSGIATFKKSEGLREVIKYVPLDRLFIETDTPYLAPQSKRGEVNEPGFIGETAAVVAKTKGISIEEVAEATSMNASKFFSFF